MRHVAVLVLVSSLAVTTMAAPLAAVAMPDVPAPPAAYIPHPPIAIYGDADFGLPTSGVIRGSGSEADPYVIGGWLIEAAAAQPLYYYLGITEPAGIYLQDTRAHVVIEENLIERAAGSPWGILLINAQNVTIDRTTSVDAGIRVFESGHVTVTNSSVSGTVSPFNAVRSSDLTLSDNAFSCHPVLSFPAITFHEVVRLVAERNSITCKEAPGIQVKYSSAIALVENVIEKSTYGIEAETVADFRVAGNKLIDNRGISMDFTWISRFNIDNNLIEGAVGMGLDLLAVGEPAEVNLVRGNRIMNSSNPFVPSGSLDPYTIRFEDNWVDNRPILFYHGLEDAEIRGEGLDPAYVIIADSRNVTVTGWEIRDIENQRMHIQNGAGVRVTGNHFENNAGLYLIGGHDNEVTWNDFEHVSRGVWAEDTGRPYVAHNIVDSFKIGLVFVYGAVDAVIERNSVRAAGHPLRLWHAPGAVATYNDFGSSMISILSSDDAVLHHNDILAGSLEVGQQTYPGPGQTPVDARWNWWGTAEGPGDPYTTMPHDAEVIAEPWLLEPCGCGTS